MRRRSKLFVSFILLSAMLCMTNTYRFAYRTFISFPFDPELGIVEKRTIPNGDNSPVEEVVIIAPNSTSQECIDDWKGDGNCDESNNNVACDYDGGDCCRKTCEDNCSTNSCGFECGTVNLYNCINPSAGCHICVHGTCQDPTSCLQSDAVVNLAIDVCTLIPWSMGNGSTVDAFCGKDPNRLIVHDTDDPTKHFDGCGFTQEKCTLEPCCSDIETAIVVLESSKDFLDLLI